MSQFSEAIDNLDTFEIGKFKYTDQVVVENYVKTRNCESKLNRLRRIFNELDIKYTINTPYTRTAQATYIKCEENELIRLIDQTDLRKHISLPKRKFLKNKNFFTQAIRKSHSA